MQAAYGFVFFRLICFLIQTNLIKSKPSYQLILQRESMQTSLLSIQIDEYETILQIRQHWMIGHTLTIWIADLLRILIHTVFPRFILLIFIFIFVLYLFLFRAIESNREWHGNDEQWNEGSRETHHRNGKVVRAMCLPLEQVRFIQRSKHYRHLCNR